VVLRPPTPVTAAVHGVCALPVYVTEAGQLMTVEEVALAIVKVTFVAVAVVWFASLQVDEAVAVPALVLPV
jgi:hypothetical protein